MQDPDQILYENQVVETAVELTEPNNLVEINEVVDNLDEINKVVDKIICERITTNALLESNLRRSPRMNKGLPPKRFGWE